jgi:hypothetical protein
VASTFSPINLWDITLNAGKTVELSVTEGYTTMLFVRKGSVVLEGGVLGPADLALLEREGTSIKLLVQDDTNLLLIGGAPINEPIVASGPFVMNTEQEIRLAMMDYQSGRMGNMANE